MKILVKLTSSTLPTPAFHTPRSTMKERKEVQRMLRILKNTLEVVKVGTEERGMKEKPG